MKLTFILLYLFLYIVLANCSNFNKINHNNIKKQLNNNNQLKLWVFFNKKETQVINKNNRESFGISELSYERRVNRAPNKDIIFDELDLPVLESHINEILNCSTNENGIEVVHKSKWLNSISIIIKNKINDKQFDKILECVVSKEFVKEIDIVSKFKHLNKHNLNKNLYNKYNHKNNNVNTNNILKRFNNIKLQLQINDSNENNNFYGGSIKAINQTFIYKLHELGYSGRGVTILVCDTGFYKDHEVFQHLKILDEYDFINKRKNTTEPINLDDLNKDQNVHGTASLSVIGALLPGTLVGPAFSSNYLLAKTEIVEGPDRTIEEDNWIAAIEWGESKGACVVSSSLSYLFYDYPQLNGKISRLSKIVNWAISKGMVIVNSMGNNGEGLFGAPADSELISVGAVDEYGNKADFSSTGPTSDGRVKPDVAALGWDVIVAFVRSRNNYYNLYGTSFACPLVSGIVALLMQAHPNWSSSQIKQALLKTSSQNQNPDNKLGYGIVNAYEAFKYYPLSENCFIGGCSGHGTCCFGKCLCAPSFYGLNCEYKRIECGEKCNLLNGVCEINNIGKSYNCLYKNNTQLIFNQNTNQMPKCVL